MVALRSQGNWRWEGPLGTPLSLVHWKRASSPVEAGTSGFLWFQTLIAGSLQTGDRRVRPRLGLRHGTPLASRGVPGERGHLSSCIWNLGFFSGPCTGESLPLRVDFIHRVEFGEVSGHRVLIKRGPGNRGASQCGSTHEARLECRRETGLILRCDRKVGNSFQTKQGSRPSCRDQEGRRGSEEVVPENLSVPLEGDRDFGELCGSHQGCQGPFRPPIPNVGLLLRRCSGKGLHLR